jgi:formylglycine-generating enzyme required for sulfatase activity
MKSQDEGVRQLRMVKIPAGTFLMGSAAVDDDPNSDEGPVHAVNINYEFFLGETEVTQAQWAAVMGDLPNELVKSPFGQGDNYPVYDVSWDDICGPGGFLDRINAMGQGHFRLPSEAEWEYTCRAGTETAFSFGESDACELGLGDCEAGKSPGYRSDYMWFGLTNNENGFPMGNKPVGSLYPNSFGLYDMHGSVWEWCQDWYRASYADAPTDGSAVENPLLLKMKVFRGGHWGDLAWYCRSSMRTYCDPDNRSAIRGFRLAWDQE